MREKKKLHRSKDVHVLGKVPLQSLSLWLPLILEIEALPLKPSNLILVLLNAKHPENVFRILKEGGVGLLPQSLSPKPQQNLWKDVTESFWASRAPCRASSNLLTSPWRLQRARCLLRAQPTSPACQGLTVQGPAPTAHRPQGPGRVSLYLCEIWRKSGVKIGCGARCE